MKYIYIHYFDDWTKPFYVGKGVNRRCDIKNNRNKYWKNLVIKYGEPKVKIMNYYETNEDANIAEMALVGFFGRRINGTGILTNITSGGDGHTGRIGKAHPMYGKKHTEESLKKMSVALKGKLVGEKNGMFGKGGELNPMWGVKRPEEYKERMSQRMKGKYDGEKNPFYGKKHSLETLKKLSESQKGAKRSEEAKKKTTETLLKFHAANRGLLKGKFNYFAGHRNAFVLDERTGVFYYSIAEAARNQGIDRRFFHSIITGKSTRKTHLKIV